MKFTLHIDPPRTTAQQHRFGGFGRNGRAILYDGAKLRDARNMIAGALGIGLVSSDVFSVPEYADGWNNAVKIIMAAPTVDAAPIVQCKYCAKRYTAECLMEYECACGAQYSWESDDEFCSGGARKTDD